MSSGIWTPTQEGPHEAFVERLVRVISAFAESHGVQTPLVEVELADSGRFVLERLDPEPGAGMVTLHVHADEDDDVDALIVPLGSIRRIELRKSPEHRLAAFGFNLPR
ncbi:MAG TPA: hypothetical protein VGK79_02420 [Gaiellaceae bacterium]